MTEGMLPDPDDSQAARFLRLVELYAPIVAIDEDGMVHRDESAGLLTREQFLALMEIP